MTDRIPVKGVIVSGAATALAEYEPTDRIPADYLGLPKGYIEGLKMEWVSGTSVRLTTGAAYVPSLDRVLDVPAAITKAGLSLTASTLYHVFLLLSGATPDFEIVTTAPAAAYSGTARAKTGDASRRYIGSIRTMGSGAIAKFTHDPAAGAITYLEDINTVPFALVAGGTATTPTTISCSAVVPITSKRAKFLANNNASGQTVFMSNSEAVSALSTSNWLAFISPAGSFYAEYPLDASQAFNYLYSAAPSGGQAFIRVAGYSYER